MNKTYVMLGVAVVLGVLGFIVNHDSSGRGPDREGAVDVQDVKLPAIDAARVHAIELSDPDNHVRISRLGEKWVLPEKFNAPVIDAKPRELLDKLKGLERSERVSKGAASARDKTFGLEPEAAKRVRLYDENNKVIVDLWIGKPDLSGDRSLNVAGNFVRMEGNDTVFSHNNRLAQYAQPTLSMWLDGRVFPLEAKELEETMAKVERLTVEFDDVPFTPGAPTPASTESRSESSPAPRVRVVLKGVDVEQPADVPASDIGPRAQTPPTPQKPRKQKDWTLVEPADGDIKPYPAFVDQVLRSLMYCRAEDVAGSDPSLAEFGLNRPFVDVELALTDGGTRHLRVGSPAPAPSEPTRRGGSYRYAVVDGTPRVFLINEIVLPQFRKKPADLKSPETPRVPAAGQAAPIELPKDAPDSRK